MELSSDSAFLPDEEIDQLANSDVILVTPEKLNIIIRRYALYQDFIERIQLLIIDEIHTLGDESRGPILESAISRIKHLKKIHKSELVSKNCP